jgi:ribosomal protein L29
MPDLYETDFYAWTRQQAELLRAGKLPALDVAHLAEEIESMGRSERNQLANRLAVLLAHLLKWRFQPGLRGNRWRLTIREQRRRAARVLAQNPSLGGMLDAILADAYGDAVLMAERETGLSESTFPAACPWTFDQAMQDELTPE